MNKLKTKKNKYCKTVVMAEFSDVRYDARVLKSAQALSKVGYVVHLYMYNSAINQKQTFKENNIEFNIYPFKNRRTGNSLPDKLKKYYEALVFLFIVNLKILFKNVDVYHAHNLKFLIFTFISSLIHKGKFVYDAHEIHSEHYDNTSIVNKVKNKINMFVEKIVLTKCHAFIQASNERAEFISKKYNINQPIVINNYVPKRVYSSQSNLLKEIFKIPNQSPIMFYSGGIYLDRYYGFKNIFKTMVNSPNVHMVILGFLNDEIKILLENDVKYYSLENRIFLHSPVNNNELLNYAASADFGIIPLMGDSLNTKLSALNKVSEYLMAGLPILCSDYTNLQKIIYSNPVGKVGETFNIDSTDSISKAINSILKNKQYKKLKPNALKLAHEFFNWEKEEEKLINIYATINTTT